MWPAEQNLSTIIYPFPFLPPSFLVLPLNMNSWTLWVFFPPQPTVWTLIIKISHCLPPLCYFPFTPEQNESLLSPLSSSPWKLQRQTRHEALWKDTQQRQQALIKGTLSLWTGSESLSWCCLIWSDGGLANICGLRSVGLIKGLIIGGKCDFSEI